MGLPRVRAGAAVGVAPPGSTLCAPHPVTPIHPCATVSKQAMQIHVLQRVVAKKEDPNTHVKFVDVLRAVHGGGGAAVASGARLQVHPIWPPHQTPYLVPI